MCTSANAIAQEMACLHNRWGSLSWSRINQKILNLHHYFSLQTAKTFVVHYSIRTEQMFDTSELWILELNTNRIAKDYFIFTQNFEYSHTPTEITITWRQQETFELKWRFQECRTENWQKGSAVSENIFASCIQVFWAGWLTKQWKLGHYVGRSTKAQATRMLANASKFTSERLAPAAPHKDWRFASTRDTRQRVLTQFTRGRLSRCYFVLCYWLLQNALIFISVTVYFYSC